MTETPITLTNIAMLAALANGIIPADDRDAGAAAVHAGPGIAERMRRSPYAAVYLDGLRAAHEFAKTMFAKSAPDLTAGQMHELHERVAHWARGLDQENEFALCAITELGFGRVLKNGVRRIDGQDAGD